MRNGVNAVRSETLAQADVVHELDIAGGVGDPEALLRSTQPLVGWKGKSNEFCTTGFGDLLGNFGFPGAHLERNGFSACPGERQNGAGVETATKEQRGFV